jgi:hypothetical protein
MKCFFTRFGLCATMAFAFAGVSTPAGAQDSPPAALPAPLPNAQPYPAPPAPPAPSVVNTAPFAGITALGQTLKNEGIYLQPW